MDLVEVHQKCDKIEQEMCQLIPCCEVVLHAEPDEPEESEGIEKA